MAKFYYDTERAAPATGLILVIPEIKDGAHFYKLGLLEYGIGPRY